MDYYQQLLGLFQQIHEHYRFADALPQLEPTILKLLGAERLTIYQKNRYSQDIVSRFKTGNEIKEIRLPLAPNSLAGFVALAKRPLRVKDAYDDDELHRIHPKLNFAKRFDKSSNFRTRSVLVVPIIDNEVLLGVMQLLNRTDGGTFDDQDSKRAIEIAAMLGQKFRYELGGTRGPFDYLRAHKLLSEEQLAQINGLNDIHLQVRKVRDEFAIKPELIGHSLEVFFQVPYLPYHEAKYLLHAASKKLNSSYLKKNLAVVLADAAREPIVLMAKPNDSDLLMEIEQATGLSNYAICVGLGDDILRYLGESGAPSAEQLGDLGDILDEFDVDTNNDSNQDEEHVNEDAPTVVKLVNRVLHDAKRLNASDIHIEPNKGNAPTKVRVRVDGICQELIDLPASHLAAVVARIKIISRLDIAERRLPQDGKFAVKIDGKMTEVRVATLPTVFGEGVVMRILASGAAMPFDKLNLSARNASMLSTMIERPHGIILVVGPTGSGKTTTLHAVLGKLNTSDRKIWTAEDPVEITQPGLQQVQMNNKIGLNFATALRAFLRADPDVILIGEMRDKETAAAGIEASLTGHLVLSTLHTNSAPETITRLIDIGLDPINFADACVGILAQRLIRTLCGKCKQAYQASADEVSFIRRHYGEQYADELEIPSTLTLYKASGCSECNQTGYRGRVGVHELLPVGATLKQLIYQGANVANIKQQGMNDGMRTLSQDGILKVLQGITDFSQLQAITTIEH